MTDAAPHDDLPLTLEGFAVRARATLPPQIYDYFATGAADEITLAANGAAWRNLALRQRVLIDVSAHDTSTTILGRERPHPFIAAPMAWQTLAHPGGEAEHARGIAAASGIFTLSCWSSQPVAEVAQAAPDVTRWLHLHIFTDRGLTQSLVEQAREHGFEALVLTIDQPVAGHRYRTAGARFTRPGSPILSGYTPALDPTVTWDDVAELAASAGLPLIVKGLLDAADVPLAIDSGVAGIVVSNHGARQLDTVLPTAVALPAVVDAVAGAVDVLVDGGIRRGTDAVKALALGASGVLVGRQLLWSLASGGAPAVQSGLELLVTEFRTALAVIGIPHARDLDRHTLLPAPWANWPASHDPGHQPDERKPHEQ